MLLTRGIEERGHILYQQGKIPGSFYTGRGNEAAAVGVATAMGPTTSEPRCTATSACTSCAGSSRGAILAKYMGRARRADEGQGRQRPPGRRAPRHDLDGQPSARDAPGRGRLRARLPHPRGAARRGRLVRRGRIGARRRSRGDEPSPASRRLPVVFVCDNNQWAYSTPTHLEYACEHLADRAAAYGFDGVVVDGTDVLAVYREAKRAIEKAREGGGPTLLECLTLRMEGHAVHDDAFYVPKELLEDWAKRDPLERFRALAAGERRT